MLGVGPGALPSDAFMMGIDPAKQRDMMEESLEAILLLLRRRDGHHGDGLVQARSRRACSCSPTSAPSPRSPSRPRSRRPGPRPAGRFGSSLLSLGATSAGGFDVLGSHWQVMEERAEEFSTTVDRNKWRLVGPMHIAESKEQAIADVAFGLEEWVDYFQRVAALPIAPEHRQFRLARRRAECLGLRGDRHPRRRHRPDRAPPGAVRRASAPTCAWATSGPTRLPPATPTS